MNITPISFIKASNAVFTSGLEKNTEVHKPLETDSFAKTTPLPVANAYEQSEKIKSELESLSEALIEQNFYFNQIAQDAQDEAIVEHEIGKSAVETIKEEAKAKFDEVNDLLKKGDEISPDGTVLRKITEITQDGVIRMEEYSPDGKELLRKTNFLNYGFVEISEGIKTLDDGSTQINEHYYFSNGKLSAYENGLLERNDLSGEVREYVSFNDGKINFYNKNHKWYPDGTEEIEKQYFYKNGEPNVYQEGYKLHLDGTEEIEKQFEYSYLDRLAEYKEGIRTCTDGSKKIARNIKYNERSCSSNECLEGVVNYPDGSKKAEKQFRFLGTSPVLYSEDVQNAPDGSQKIAKRVVFEYGLPHSYKIGYEKGTDDAIERAEKRVYFNNGEVTTYQENYEKSLVQDTFMSNIKKRFSFIRQLWNGNLAPYIEVPVNTISDKDGCCITKIGKKLAFNHGEPIIYEENFVKTSNGNVSHTRFIQKTSNGWVANTPQDFN